MANALEVGRGNPGAVVRSAHAQAVPVEDLDDFSGQDGLELLDIRIFVPKVAKNISAAPNDFQLLAFHRNIFLNPIKRSLTRSTSRFGVLMPCVDLF